MIEEKVRWRRIFCHLIRGSRSYTGRPTISAPLGPGVHFGEMALVDRSPRSATVKSSKRIKIDDFVQEVVSTTLCVQNLC